MRYRHLLLYTVLILTTISYAYAIPTGASVTVGTPETGTGGNAGSVTAQGGNITPVDLDAIAFTTSWQGFFGNITGNLTLEDADGEVMYSWALANISGEVYASRNSTIDFTSVVGVEDCTIDETLTGTGSDRTNNTFTNATVAFTIGAVSITEACQTFTYVDSAPQSTSFEEIIVNATGVTSIYVGRISNDADDFHNSTATSDYQLIVAETEGAGTSTYFFFTELD